MTKTHSIDIYVSLWNNKKRNFYEMCGKSVAENKQTEPGKIVLCGGGGGYIAAPPCTASVLIGGNISLTARSL